MYLGSPRMAEMVIGEKVTLEEMGGAGCTRHAAAAATRSSPATRRRSTSRGGTFVFPGSFVAEPPEAAARRAGADADPRADPRRQVKPFDMRELSSG